MYCKKCNCLLDENSNFCQICGTPNPTKKIHNIQEPIIQNSSSENYSSANNIISENDKNILYKSLLYLTIAIVLISRYCSAGLTLFFMTVYGFVPLYFIIFIIAAKAIIPRVNKSIYVKILFYALCLTMILFNVFFTDVSNEKTSFFGLIRGDNIPYYFFWISFISFIINLILLFIALVIREKYKKS